MIEAPRIVATTAQPVAMLRLLVSVAEVRKVMGPGLKKVRDTIAAQGIAVAGPWLSHHFRMPAETFDYAICVPVASPIEANGRVEPWALPALTVARTVALGDYARLGTAWGEFRDWIATQGHKTRPELWECYTVGPETSPNPEDWRTELNWPLTDA